jgi:hypothetical protein
MVDMLIQVNVLDYFPPKIMAREARSEDRGFGLQKGFLSLLGQEYTDRK